MPTLKETQEQLSNSYQILQSSSNQPNQHGHGMTWIWFALICDIWDCLRIPGGILHLRPGAMLSEDVNLIILPFPEQFFIPACFLFPHVWICLYFFFQNASLKLMEFRFEEEDALAAMKRRDEDIEKQLSEASAWHPVTWRMSEEWIKNDRIYNNLGSCKLDQYLDRFLKKRCEATRMFNRFFKNRLLKVPHIWGFSVMEGAGWSWNARMWRVFQFHVAKVGQALGRLDPLARQIGQTAERHRLRAEVRITVRGVCIGRTVLVLHRGMAA